jgi:hypothetical protein
MHQRTGGVVAGTAAALLLISATAAGNGGVVGERPATRHRAPHGRSAAPGSSSAPSWATAPPATLDCRTAGTAAPLRPASPAAEVRTAAAGP